MAAIRERKAEAKEAASEPDGTQVVEALRSLIRQEMGKPAENASDRQTSPPHVFRTAPGCAGPADELVSDRQESGLGLSGRCTERLRPCGYRGSTDRVQYSWSNFQAMRLFFAKVAGAGRPLIFSVDQ